VGLLSIELKGAQLSVVTIERLLASQKIGIAIILNP
jgi:hypothetical protein